MTAFDPGALVSMLVAFYPIVSASELARARRERPDYFGDGVIFGSKGDKLRLPDGREFDCIQAAGGPASGRRWQAALIDPHAPSTDDPFALEPGPFEPLEDTPFEPRDPDLFRDLVARELRDLGDWDGAYTGARQTAIDAGADDTDDGDDPDLVDWATQLEQDGQHRREYLPIEELGAIDGISPAIDDGVTNVVDDPTGLFPDAPEPPPYEPPPDGNPPPAGDPSS